MFGRILAGLALIATLGVALLPAGQLPRLAGRCGRALCNCPLEVVPQSNPSCRTCSVTLQAPRVITLGSSELSNVDEPGLAFQLALDAAFLLPESVKFHTEARDSLTLPVAAEFALNLSTFDIPTPPPRA